MGISIVESDMASDFCSEIVETIKKKIVKELKNKANEYNTPGFINSALVLRSLISEDNDFHFLYEDWSTIWQELQDKFESYSPEYGSKEANIQYKELKDWVNEMNEKCKEMKISIS